MDANSKQTEAGPPFGAAPGYVPGFAYDYGRRTYTHNGIAAECETEVVDTLNRIDAERHRLEHDAERLREENDKLAKGGRNWAISALHFKEEAVNLAYALADALSTYGPDDEVRVTAERIEAWKQVLENSTAHKGGIK